MQSNAPFQPLIETSHLSKRYGDKLAVNDVSFAVQDGEIFGFLGPNGAGKTTTLKMIVGLLEPTSGTVRVKGYDVQKQPIQAKAVCGYVPDEPDLYAKLSGRELLRFVGDLYDLDRPHIARRIDEHLVRWAMQKFKRLRGNLIRAWKWLHAEQRRRPRLFAHWYLLASPQGRTAGAV